VSSHRGHSLIDDINDFDAGMEIKRFDDDSMIEEGEELRIERINANDTQSSCDSVYDNAPSFASNVRRVTHDRFIPQR